MSLAFRVVLTSSCIGLLTGMLVAGCLFVSLAALGAEGVRYEHLGEMGQVVFAYSVPLGALGGVIALPALRRSTAPPSERWAGRGALLGVAVGALGSSALPILVGGSVDDAAFVAFPGGLAGALAGCVTASILSTRLKLERSI